MRNELMPSGELLLYQYDGDKQFVSVIFDDETFWLTQNGMAELFDCTPENITQHLKNIYAEEELSLEATAKKFLVVRKEGTRNVRREIDHYNLDAIIAVGYRVNSKKATRFRQWATKTLKEYIQKGFVLNDKEMTAEEYQIKSISGKDFLFVQHKSGDYFYGGMTPHWYVFERKDD